MKYNIPRTTSNNWIKNKNYSIPHGKKRIKGGGRKPIVPKVYEENLYNWLIKLREAGAPVTVEIFLAEARNLNVIVPGFSASRGWFNRYCYRWGLSIRKCGEMTPFALIHGTSLHRNISNLWINCEMIRKKFSISMKNIINIDEVPVWFDCTTGRVIEKKGVKRASVRTNGRQKKRMTVILSICADGTMLKPLLIFHSLGKPNVREKLISQFKYVLLLESNESAYSNNLIFLSYLKELFPENNLEHKLLIMDTSNTHGYLKSAYRIVGPIDDYLKSVNCHIGIVPEHCTPMVQFLDTHINKPFKNSMKKKWDQHMTNNINNIFSNGKVINSLWLAREITCKFVVEAIKTIPMELIIKSFKQTGYSMNLDGTEEHLCNIETKKF